VLKVMYDLSARSGSGIGSTHVNVFVAAFYNVPKVGM
jgi:hypothetical protein